MSARGTTGAAAVLLIGMAAAAGCTTSTNTRSVESAATTPVVLPDPAGPSVIPSTDRSATALISDPAARTADSGGIPVCGSDVPPFMGSGSTSTPAPDTCSFPAGGSASPTCPDQPTEVVTANETRSPAAGDRLSGSPIAAFGRFGGRGGRSMCCAEYRGGAVLLSNTDQAVLLPPSTDPMRVAGARSWPEVTQSGAPWTAGSTMSSCWTLLDRTAWASRSLPSILHPGVRCARVVRIAEGHRLRGRRHGDTGRSPGLSARGPASSVRRLVPRLRGCRTDTRHADVLDGMNPCQPDLEPNREYLVCPVSGVEPVLFAGRCTEIRTR